MAISQTQHPGKPVAGELLLVKLLVNHSRKEDAVELDMFLV